MLKDDKRLRIGFICPGIYPVQTGGMEIFNYHLISALSDKYKVTLFTSNEVFINDNVETVVISPKLFGNSAFKIGQITFTLRTFLKIARDFKDLDVIHISFTSKARYYGLFYPWLFTKLRIPYVISNHGGGLLSWKPKWLYKRFFKYASLIVAVSEIIQNEYRRRTQREVRLIYPLIPFERTEKPKEELRELLKISTDRFVILFLGTLKGIKCPDILLQAIYLLGSEYLEENRILVLFVGDGEMRKELEVFVKENQLNEYVKFVGVVPFEETNKYYEAADLFIIPSKYEGTSKALAGAMFNALPIIGTDVQGINNVIKQRENGMLFPYNDAKALVETIRVLINEQDLLAELGSKVKMTYDKLYSFEKTIKEFEEVYNEAIQTAKALNRDDLTE